jgi:plastocyanin
MYIQAFRGKTMNRSTHLLALASAALLSSVQGQTAPPVPVMAPDTMAAVSSDAATRTVRVNLIAGQGTMNNGLNFNGAAKGDKTLTVPLGWTVEVAFSNMGRAPHNALVLAGPNLPTTFNPAKVPFAGASTKVIAPGGAGEKTTFVANRPGSYYLLCAVGKHAQNGMYIKMVVANSIKAATFQ